MHPINTNREQIQTHSNKPAEQKKKDENRITDAASKVINNITSKPSQNTNTFVFKGNTKGVPDSHSTDNYDTNAPHKTSDLKSNSSDSMEEG